MRRALWPTPTETDSSSSARMTCERSCDWKSNAGTTLTDAVRLAEAGLPLNRPAPHLAGGGLINPDWCESLMGFPHQWTRPSPGGSWLGWPAPPGEPQYGWESPRIGGDPRDRPSRLRALGNAVVPQCAAAIVHEYLRGRRIKTIGGLFAGIGGLELGAEAALDGAARTIWQVERESYALKVLESHWPKAQRFNDVRAVGAQNLEPVDLMCGGFPCQDVSLMGTGKGLAGAKSGLWHEFHRIVVETRPRHVLIENVSALRRRGLDVVTDALDAIGYDTTAKVIKALDVGAPQRRERIFIVAALR